ncbi:MAG: ECF transporter S component [Ruminococcaceae bacterium]|nr:ECF transporter S component [Oscillospiraceae bacterium]
MKISNGAPSVRKLAYAALCLALALVLPFLTGQIPEIGNMLCPMHIPALLCGFLCGWPWGLVVGGIAPILRSLLFVRPPMFSAIGMAFELAVYGAAAGFLYRKLPKSRGSIYAALIIAMIAGRLVWGVVQIVLMGLQDSAFTLQAFLASAVTTAIPGIILQLVLIPVVVMALEKARLIPED